MKCKLERRAGLLAAAALLLVSSSASADVVAQGSQPFTEPNGAYSGVKSFTVYTHDDASNPAPGAPGELTYVYELSNDASSPLSIIGFTLEVPLGSLVAVGSIDDANTATPPPSAVTDVATANGTGAIRWDWAAATGLIAPGASADELYVISAYTPGSVSDNVYGIEGEFAFDLTGTCVGPHEEPTAECDLEVVKDACVVQPEPPPGDACEGKAVAFDFQYTGLGCDASSNLQDPKKLLCIGGADGDDPVDIIVFGEKHKRHHGWWGWWNKHTSKKIYAQASDVHVGDVVTVSAGHGNKHTLGSSVQVKIKTKDGWSYDVVELDKFDTSCRQPLGPGNQFGSVLITSLTSTRGGTVELPEDPPSEDCVTQIDVAEAPHCKGKIESLTLRYTGGDCDETMTSQDPGKVTCNDSALPGTFPVRVIVSDGANPPPYSNAYVDESPLVVGDLITVEANQCSHSNLTSTTGFWIKKASDDSLVQDGSFHTSCSQPLNLGDQIGALQVFAMTTTEGGTVALGQDVEYTYEVTNPNASDAVNVSVDDDQLGNIASGVTIPAGGTETFTATALIDEETTNVATVNGEVDGTQCNEATAQATITVSEPPPPVTVCTTAVQAMTLRYVGPTRHCGSDSVKITSDNLAPDWVSYGDIDLISNHTVLTKSSENGFSVDATAHDEIELGAVTTVKIDGVPEELDTSCLQTFEAGEPVPLVGGGVSSNWVVDSFTQKE